MLDDQGLGTAIVLSLPPQQPVSYTYSAEQVLWLGLILAFALVFAFLALAASDKPKV